MNWNSRGQICLDFKSDIAILILMVMYITTLLESIIKGFSLNRSQQVLTIINSFLMSLSQWGGVRVVLMRIYEVATNNFTNKNSYGHYAWQ